MQCDVIVWFEIRVGQGSFDRQAIHDSEHSVAIGGEQLFQQTQHTSNGKRRDVSFSAVRK